MKKNQRIFITILFLAVLGSPAYANPGNFGMFQAIPMEYLIGMLISLVISAFFYRKRTGMTVMVIVMSVLVTSIMSLPLFGTFLGSWSFNLPLWILALFTLNVSYLFQEEEKYKKVLTGALLWINLSIFVVYMIIVGPLNILLVNNFDGCQSNQRNMSTVLEVYAQKHDGKYPESLSELVPDYLKEIPRCFPGGHTEKTQEYYRKLHGLDLGDYHYEVSADRKRYTTSCQGFNHRQAPMGYPKFSSEMGLIPRPGEEGKH